MVIMSKCHIDYKNENLIEKCKQSPSDHCQNHCPMVDMEYSDPVVEDDGNIDEIEVDWTANCYHCDKEKDMDLITYEKADTSESSLK